MHDCYFTADGKQPKLEQCRKCEFKGDCCYMRVASAAVDPGGEVEESE